MAFIATQTHSPIDAFEFVAHTAKQISEISPGNCRESSQDNDGYRQRSDQ